MKTLTVPERLKEAAKSMRDNKIILLGLSDEQKEVVKLAVRQDALTTYTAQGGKRTDTVTNIFQYIAYCLPDDIEIVVEQEQTWWEKEGLILCPIEKQPISTGWMVKYPNEAFYDTETLGIPRCEGYEFCGFVHNDKIEDWQDIKSECFRYTDKKGRSWITMQEVCKPSTATHTVWRKIEVK